MAEYLLEMNHITKIFPGVKALDDVSFNLKKGEIHAIVGENGAGKSTFIKTLTGVHQPDGGEIILDGEKIVMSDPLVAQKHGIAAIYQHAASYPDLSAAENIFIGHEFMVGPFISWTKANREAQKLLDSVGANFPATASVGSLSVAQQQLVEIAKALSQKARILIMDEPTAALSKRESEELYSIARKLRDEGVAIILISHRFEDIFGLADRATVFRDAHYIGIGVGLLDAYGARLRRVPTDTVTTIAPGIHLVPHTTEGLAEAGSSAGMLLRGEDGWLPDDFAHEVSLVFELGEGDQAPLAVFNSCSHAGLSVIAGEVRAAFPGRAIAAYVGGLHLVHASDEAILDVARAVDAVGIGCVYTGHCTGAHALELLECALPGRVVALRPGLVF